MDVRDFRDFRVGIWPIRLPCEVPVLECTWHFANKKKKEADLQLMGIEYRLLNEKKQTDKPSDLVGRERLHQISR